MTTTGRKVLLGIVAAAVAAIVAVSAAESVEAAPSSYDAEWSQPMNHTSYWAPWQCTKYNGHGGWIPAQYDAAIIKAGQKVRVYPDLESVGEFQASAPDGKDISWVMKCTKPVPPTSTSTTTTTAPEQTTTTSTTLPDTTTSAPTTSSPTTTQAPTTSAAPTTTVSESTSTSSPTTSSPPETPTSTTGDTQPPSVSIGTAPVPPIPPAQPSSAELPATGAAETFGLFVVALALVLAGIGAVHLARRD